MSSTPAVAPQMVTPFGNLAPTVAWKSLPFSGGVAMIHQRSLVGTVQTTCSGYGGVGEAIVEANLTVFATDGGVTVQRSIPRCQGGNLPVDFALSPDESVAVVVEAGSRGFSLLRLAGLSDGGAIGGCSRIQFSLAADGGTRPIAADVTADNRLVVQTEEPALVVYAAYALGSTSLTPGALVSSTPLPRSAVRQTGHRLFHDATRGNISCAGCHPEGQDDGHVWTFAGIGARRTQTLGGGISTTALFHWDGDMTDFATLMREVMQKRMTGPALDPTREASVMRWIESVPAPKAPAKDVPAALRGKTLFESATVGCSSCHSGAKFTNNGSADVGTGKAFPVPPLLGLGTRAPFMHNGCAKTLADRFGSAPCGGGDSHGQTSQLSAGELSDLLAYLTSL